MFKSNIIIAWFFAVAEQACNLGNPVLLRWFLGSFNEDAEDGSGYQLAFWMLFVSMLQTFIGNHGFLIVSSRAICRCFCL